MKRLLGYVERRQVKRRARIKRANPLSKFLPEVNTIFSSLSAFRRKNSFNSTNSKRSSLSLSLCFVLLADVTLLSETLKNAKMRNDLEIPNCNSESLGERTIFDDSCRKSNFIAACLRDESTWKLQSYLTNWSLGLSCPKSSTNILALIASLTILTYTPPPQIHFSVWSKVQWHSNCNTRLQTLRNRIAYKLKRRPFKLLGRRKPEKFLIRGWATFLYYLSYEAVRARFYAPILWLLFSPPLSPSSFFFLHFVIPFFQLHLVAVDIPATSLPALALALSVSHPSNKTPVPLSYRTECGSTPIARAHNSLHPRRVFRNLRRTAAAVASLFAVRSWLGSLGRTHGDDGRAFVSN